LLQDCFGLILMNFHNDSWLASLWQGHACGFNLQAANHDSIERVSIGQTMSVTKRGDRLANQTHRVETLVRQFSQARIQPPIIAHSTMTTRMGQTSLHCNGRLADAKTPRDPNINPTSIAWINSECPGRLATQADTYPPIPTPKQPATRNAALPTTLDGPCVNAPGDM